MRHEACCDISIVILFSGLNPVFSLLRITMKPTLFALAKVVNISTAQLQNIARASTGFFL
jgi:hypothetical protein